MYNRILTKKDLEDGVSYISSMSYDVNYKHELWHKDDAILKWTAILKSIESFDIKKSKIVDLGCGDSKIAPILRDLGNTLTGIDLDKRANGINDEDIDIIIGDAMEVLKNMETDSVDVFYDSCSVTHFYTEAVGDIPNIGWHKISKEISRILKTGGLFIIASDCRINDDIGEFVSPKQIIDIIQKNHLKLSSEYQDFDERYSFEYKGEMCVVSLSFLNHK
jgi:SAM-dependent methyltransferase